MVGRPRQRCAGRTGQDLLWKKRGDQPDQSRGLGSGNAATGKGVLRPGAGGGRLSLCI